MYPTERMLNKSNQNESSTFDCYRQFCSTTLASNSRQVILRVKKPPCFLSSTNALSFFCYITLYNLAKPSSTALRIVCATAWTKVIRPYHSLVCSAFAFQQILLESSGIYTLGCRRCKSSERKMYMSLPHSPFKQSFIILLRWVGFCWEVKGV